jgi:hypothetical protein
MTVGPALISELSRLRGEPIDAETAVEVVALMAKAEAWLAAQKMIFTADALHGVRGMPLPAGEATMLTAQEIACATHVPYASARNHVGLVERVGDCQPQSWEALDRGELSLAHLKAVERATRSCTPRVAQAVDAHIVPLAVQRGWTPSEVARAAAKLVIALDPDGAADRAAEAKANADVQLFPAPDEVSTLVANGPAELNLQIMDAIRDHAERMARAGDHRPAGLRRFHALAELVLGATDTSAGQPGPGKQPARRAGTTLVGTSLDLTTLLGQDDHPGELAGYGPITAQTARRIAADSMLRKLVLDPLTGNTLDLGRSSYRPSAALRAVVEATRPVCGMPGCSRPARDCEIDHRREYHRTTDPGRTDRCNLGPLCKLHHQLKTKKLWTVDINPDGTETWTSPLGFTHTKKPSHFPLPEPLPADDQPPADIADRLPHTFDPDPPHPDQPLPEPPPLTDEQYEAMEHAIDTLNLFDITFREWCDRHYDEARATGLVA